MIFEDLKKALSDAIMDLKPAPIPDEHVEFEMVTLDRSEADNSKWLSYIMAALDGAKTFEIHCWSEKTEWIALGLLGQPKPADTEIYNKMTPFFNVFLDDKFQSCHYGTELYI